MADETSGVTIREVMTPLPVGLHPDDPLRDASVRSAALGVDPIPVTEDGRLVGQISAAAMQAQAARSGLATGDVPVKQVMEQPQTVLRADEPLHDAAEKLPDFGTHAFVVDAQGNFVGTVPLAVLRKHLDEHADDAGVSAVLAVESIPSLVEFESDRLDFMSDESFPASDPIPPPGSLGPDDPGS
ncbi:MAG TPA: CBS domain-containing protein [Chloroflexota bacterium]|nr:CBS domain-containing protein [Chloroflexota bacterium]